MRLNDYQDLASTTADYPGRGFGPLGLAYTSLGLISEVGEWVDAVQRGEGINNVMKEQGDILWYASQCAVELVTTFEELLGVSSFEAVTRNHLPFEIARSVASMGCFRLADRVKKHIRDDGGELPDDRREAIARLVVEIVVPVLAHGNLLGLDPNRTAELNVEKLSDRKARGLIHGTGGDR